MRQALITVCIMLAVFGIWKIRSVPVVETIKPIFEIGDCLQLSKQQESWEKSNPIWRIVEIGEENYGVCEFEEHCKSYLEENTRRGPIYLNSISFQNAQEEYKKIGCNSR